KMTGSMCRCSSVETTTALTSGRDSSSRKSVVTKSAPHFSRTISPRSGLISAIPIQSTWGWRAASSPRMSPTRPAPTMARPMRFACFFMRRVTRYSLLVSPDRLAHRGGGTGFGQREAYRLVALRGQVRGDVKLHHRARLLGSDEHRAVACDGLQEMHRLRLHRAG